MSCRIKMLYWGTGPLGKNEKTTSHTHDFCQLELAIRGTNFCRSGKDKFLFADGEGLFIPPGHAHSFSRSDQSDDSHYYSFKFRLTEGKLPPAPVILPRDHFSGWIADTLCALLGKETGPFKYVPTTAEILEVLIGSFLERYTLRFLPASPLPPFLENLRMQVSQYGAKISVKFAAEKAGLQLIQYRYRFKKEAALLPPLEHYSSPGKFIDHLLLESACLHLTKSDMPIKNIALILGFNNNFTFSRFFRRMTGMSPSQYRIQFASFV